MTAAEVRVATDEAFDLAEGPVWDPARQRLLWVDIRRGRVLVGRLVEGDRIETIDEVVVPGTVGAVAVAESGEWVLAGAERLLFRGVEGTVAPGPRVLPSGADRRLNDGKPDPAGRFVVGTLSSAGPSQHETLSVVDGDGTVAELDDDLTLSNGLAWTADGATLYSIDTMTGSVFRRAYDVATGTAGPRSLLLDLGEETPDGMCLDAEGHLWIAVWGAGQVRRYAPDGRLVRTIDVPAPHTSCVQFAGADLDVLVITTATQDMTAEQLVEHPLAGRVFTVRPGVRGLPQPLWAGPAPTTRTRTESTA